jgi:uncharacterized protein DUF4242
MAVGAEGGMMARFMVTRTLPRLSSAEIDAIGRRVVDVAAKMGNIKWIRTHLTADGKHSFCEFEAPSAEVCRQHAEAAELPLDDVIALGSELGPHLFS